MAEGYNPMLDDKWRVYIGAFDASVDSKITFKAENLPEVPIDIEDVLGLEDSKTVAWGGVAWHFAEKHALEFETFTLNRNDSDADTYTPPLQVGDFFIEDGEFLAVLGPTPLISPDPRYFSRAALVAGLSSTARVALNCRPYFGLTVQAPINSMVAPAKTRVW